jgi:energy-coupling factor transporter ATP-binding protein EcfA2
MSLNTKPAEPVPEVVVISGDNGSGKTTLANCFPNPYIINAENIGAVRGQKHWETGGPKDWAEIRSAVKDFLTEPHEYKTLIVDSVNAIEALAVSDIFARNPGKTNLAECDGGYGGGHNSLYKLMGDFTQGMLKVRDVKKCYVVLVVHSRPLDIELPGTPTYQQWQPSLMKTKAVDVGSLFRRDSDLWLHCFARYTTTEDQADDARVRRLIGTSSAVRRVIGVDQTPTYFAKNRRGWTGFVDFEPDAKSFLNKLTNKDA